MREIKFRAWDGTMERMDYDFEKSEFFTEKMNNPREWQDCIVMQYTNLKDKNNIEIYEGDLVQEVKIIKGKDGRESEIRGDIYVVEWLQFGYRIKNINDDKDGTVYTRNDWLEKIGTIYEN